jgi:AGCS family alanine or glycine:cation symporter
VSGGTSIPRGSSVAVVEGELVWTTTPDGTAGQTLEISWAPLSLAADEWAATGPLTLDLRPELYRTYGGAALTAVAFDRAFPGLGKWLVTLAAWLFALSTMISWSYYGEQGVVYLVGEKLVLPYKLVFLVAAAAAPIAATNVDALLAVIDFGTGAMLWGNIPILLLMGHLAVREMNRYADRLKRGDIQPHARRSQAGRDND